MYNKLFSKILDSSLWLESDATRLVWITFLAVMDQDGFCEFASVANVAHRARVSLDSAEDALRTLEGPDAISPGQDYEGRRVERVPGGWMVLNARKYRDIVTTEIQRSQTRERVRRHRERERVRNADSNGAVTPSEAEAEAEAEASTNMDTESFDAFWSAYPKRGGGNPKRDALGCWRARLRDGHTAATMIAGVDRYAAFIRATGRENTEFVMQARRFVGPSLPFSEAWDVPSQPRDAHRKPNVGEQTYENAKAALEPR